MGILELAGAAVVAIAIAFFSGRSSGKAKERERLDKDYIDTRKRMDEVVIDDDVGAAREWLHERGK